MAEKLLVAQQAFLAEVRGNTLRVRKGQAVSSLHPVVAGRVHLFRELVAELDAPKANKPKKDDSAGG